MSATPEPIAALERVTKRYDQVVAVDGIDLGVPEGQFATLLGPSGCGKSTTLRLLGGFERPSHGRILLAGEDVTHLPPNRRDLNIVFQDYALFPHMSVTGNVAFGLELKGLSKATIAARVGELLELLQLGALSDRMPDQLSGGQRQRVALARALAPDPKVLLLDEPLGALDAKLRGQVQIELKAIQQRTGKTFIFVTHDQDEALTMSDRIVVMDQGRIEQDGTPEELYHRPVNRFVADFIGETNLLRCTVRGQESDHLVLDWNGLTLRAVAGAGSWTPGTAVETALRPESIVCGAAPPALANALEGWVVSRVFKGSRTNVDIALDQDGAVTLQVSLDSFVLDGLDGERIWIGWPADRMAVLRT